MFGYEKSRAVLAGTTMLLMVGTTMLLPVHADDFALPVAVDVDTLEMQRAKQNISTLQLSHMTSNAGLSNTTMEGVFSSGDNVLSMGVLEHAQGINTIIQNTGHNVIIQESLILNVNVSP
ncbi:hypothetical protein [Ectothiorhodospira lacustris]|uniref:hypothetical protein n=1 Tax=Ectothiorhodospira lacustris TaxID=2899127 RepID=UPI001EE7BCF1|nr:hypothetical protein [Ectothiorhodospira lacustris]MCG5502244.1 hypothetical protein [Ectothiorhodospira lacustris]MCG5509880.1 hypothetical protein [Ectothiorhodospira lacustris]MCG5521133.1 hypothetical protein [Ectothiorhodospira lacustris]